MYVWIRMKLDVLSAASWEKRKHIWKKLTVVCLS